MFVKFESLSISFSVYIAHFSVTFFHPTAVWNRWGSYSILIIPKAGEYHKLKNKMNSQSRRWKQTGEAGVNQSLQECRLLHSFNSTVRKRKTHGTAVLHSFNVWSYSNKINSIYKHLYIGKTIKYVSFHFRSKTTIYFLNFNLRHSSSS